jgi:hypothetical protein
MKDYSDIGLDQFGRALNSPLRNSVVEQPRNYIPASTLSNPPGVISGSAGTAIVDGRGVVSIFNFVNSSGQVAAGLNQNITGTADTPITGGTLTFVLQRPAIVRYDLSLGWWITGTTLDFASAHIKENGVNKANMLFGHMYNDAMHSSTFYLSNLTTPGTYTITAEASGASNGGTSGINIYRYRMAYMIFGR